MPLPGVVVDLPDDLLMWPVTIAIWNCHYWPLDASMWEGGRSASWSDYLTCNNSNLKLPCLATRRLYWRGIDLVVDLPIWPVTIAIWNCHSWPLDAYTRGVDLSVDLPIWPVTIAIWNCDSWPLDASTRGIDWSVNLPIWPLTIVIWNCHSWPLDASTWGGGRSASWSAYVTCNNSNLKLPFFAMRCLYLGVDLPVNLPIWSGTIEIWNCHSWPLDAYTRGVDLPVDLPMWPVTIAIWNCHSWPLDASTMGVDLPVNLPIWPVTIEIWNCYSWPSDAYTRGVDLSVDLPIWPVTIAIWNCDSWSLDASTWCGVRSASWSAYVTCNNSNLKLPFLATRCLFQGVDLSVNLPIWPVTIAIWKCHSWPLDASTWGGDRSSSWSAYMTCNNSNLKLPFLAIRFLYWGELIYLYDL